MSLRQLEILVYLHDDPTLLPLTRSLLHEPATHLVRSPTSSQPLTPLAGSPAPGSSCSLRWAPGREPAPGADCQQLVLGAEYALLPAETLPQTFARARQHGLPLWVETLSAEHARDVASLGAAALIACGFEGPGFVSEETGLVLLRAVIAAAPELPVYLRGGIGPDSAAAAFMAGAAGVALDHQLWACAEWPADDSLKQRLASFDPADTRTIGHTLGMRYRVFAQIATRPPKQLAEIEAQLLSRAPSQPVARQELLSEIASRSAATPLHADLKQQLWPLGQEACLAHSLAARYESVSGILRAIRERAAHAMQQLPEHFSLGKGAGAAITNHTALPLHQGPMAQVSDTPAFARAVVDAGAMPWLALGNMPAEVAERVVWQTGEALQGRPFGAGIIGLDANRFRDAHIEMLGRAAKVFPSMMGLVAAGTAEQALQLERLGVRSYLHTPTPGVLRDALMNGQRLFLLEGTEAGGHIGQLGGLLLWQACADEITRALETSDIDPGSITVLPAGGIGDAASAAAVAALFLPLTERGVKLGLQMGTAYLMTGEAVTTGAINQVYQQVGQRSQRTVVLGESVGAPTRLLPNDAASRVAQREIERITQNVSLRDRKEAYEHDNLGGLRAAAKAQRIERVDPERGAIFASLSVEEQERDGLFHCGQGINLWREPRSIASLHDEVTTGALAHATRRREQLSHTSSSLSATTAAPVVMRAAAAPSQSAAPQTSSEEAQGLAIAIVGLGAKLPGALSVAQFWQNLEQGVSAIKEVHADRWPTERYYDADHDAPDKTYSTIGGWVEGFEFDRKIFKLPPTVVAQMDHSQTLWLAAARDAMEDAGLLERADFPRERCAVIVGNAMGGDMRDYTNVHLMFPELEGAIDRALEQGGLSPEQRQALLSRIEANVKAQGPTVTEDTMPGELGNVIAGRTAQLLDLGGPNFIVDAACASSLAAIEQAVRGLVARRFDVALTGGVDRCMGPAPFIKFSKIGALSPDGSRPFDAEANGFVMGEGAAALVLKRLEDAERDGDTIYAVIRGIGASSDGKGKAITAPNPIGQRRALERAYQEAGFSPRTVSLIEAHGTSTPVGDPVEVGALKDALSKDSAELAADHIALGSVKSMIGHLKAAAGAASLVKVSLALKNKTLPPTLNVKTPNPALELESTPLRIQQSAAPWHVKPGHARRAGVSAFGFGGTNFHVVLEEHLPASARKQTPVTSSSSSSPTTQEPSMTAPSTSASAPSSSTAPRWSEGILALSDATAEGLSQRVERVIAALAAGDEGLVAQHLLPVEQPGARAMPKSEAHGLAIVFDSREELPALLEKAKAALERGKGWRILSNQGIFSTQESARGKVAMLFPGQGSQYLGMLSGLYERYQVVRDTFDEADRIMTPALGRPLSAFIHPDLGKVEQTEAFLQLSQTEITQPAVLTIDVALLRLLESFGVHPDVVAGHSLGEYGACVAAGVMTFEESLRTVALRGTQMANASPMNGDCGLMAAIPAGADEVERELQKIQPGYVVCANKNSPSQTIIAGLTEPVRRAVEHFESLGMQVMLLPVSHAFHSEVVAAASAPLRQHMSTIDIQTPRLPILTNVTGGLYPTAPDDIRDLLAKQVAAPVEFMAMIEQMWADGARVFIEVGPKRAQAAFVSGILEGREHVSLFTNHPKKGDLRSWLEAMAMLWISGAWDAEASSTREVPQNVAPATSVAAPAQQAAPVASQPAAASGVSRDEVAARLMDVLCEKTGYDADEVETDYELEADLGIDTVKQAEIIAAVRDHYQMARDEDFRLADYPTLDALTDYVMSLLATSAPAVNTAAPTAPVAAPAPQAAATSSVSRDEVAARLMDVLCEKTGYDADEVETDYELEADLGIDTVKQAEIIAAVRDHYQMARDEDFRLADYPTLNALADYVMSRLESGAPAVTTAAAPAPVAQAVAAPAPAAASSVSRDEVAARLIDVLCEKTGYDADEVETDYELEADLGIDTVKQAEIIAAVRDHYQMARDEDFRLADYPTLNALTDYVMSRLATTAPAVNTAAPATAPVAAPASQAAATSSVSRDEVAARLMDVLCEKTGYDADEVETDYELEADLGIDTVKQAEIIAAVRDHYQMARDEDFRLADYPTLNALTDYVMSRLATSAPAMAAASVAEVVQHVVAKQEISLDAMVAAREGSLATAPESVEDELAGLVRHEVPAKVVISGSALGLPGSELLFEDGTLERLFAGANMIGAIPDTGRQAQVDNRIVRLVKHEDGSGEMVEVTRQDEVVKLAGQPGRLDLEERWGVPARLSEALDETSRMAFAAGIDALRDAGLPLLPRYRETRNGGKITIGWQLPKSIGDRTGVIFASAFTGQDALIEEVTARYNDPDYRFDHRFLLKVIGMASARFAEYIGARGPNTRVHSACSSTTVAMGIASDWLELGRCDRVIVLGADNAGGAPLRDWLLSGFLAAGAATTESRVEEAALPFDRRRHGMIVGSGAVGFVLERDGMPEERGLEPIADLLEARFVNSAFHPTRLDVDHLAEEVDAMMRNVETTYKIDREQMAARTVFVSHETFTPARGGSAEAEIRSLRNAFGAHANEVVVANTKGLTGHPMAASIEDVLAIKSLQHQQVPPIPNLREPDPSLGDLRLSQGGDYPLDYALRFSAGFGSQFGAALFRFRARTEDRLFSEARQQRWLERVSGLEHPVLEVVKRTLRVREAQPEERASLPVTKEKKSDSNGFYTLPASVTQPAPAMELPARELVQQFIPRRVRAKAFTLASSDALALGVTLLLCRAEAPQVASAAQQAVKTLGASRVITLTLGQDDLRDEAKLTAQLAGVQSVVSVLGLSVEENTTASAQAAHDASRALFHVARAWNAALGHAPNASHTWLNLTPMGGMLGLEQGAGRGAPLHGAVAGVSKSLAREWPEARVCTVDVTEGAMTDAAQLRKALQAGHDAARHGEVELGLIGEQAYRAAGEALDAEQLLTAKEGALDAGSVVLLTGGARGITASVALDLARRYGCELVLVGRSKMTLEDPLSHDVDAARERARQELLAKGERATPMALKQAVSGLVSQQEIATSMAQMQALGARVSYLSCDLADMAAVEAMVDAIYARFGRLDLMVHGAGLEVSRQLEQKDAAEFDRVFCGKAMGGVTMWRAAEKNAAALDVKLPAFIGFSSIAGRFGNVGQADYSSANEVISRQVTRIADSNRAKAMVIDWTAWAEVGMASRGSMPEILSARGVDFLPVEVGAMLPAALLELGVTGEVLVAGSLGEMGGLEAWGASEWQHSDSLPLTDVYMIEEGRVEVKRVLDLARDRFMRDHVYEGAPLMPGVMGLELMVEAAALLAGEGERVQELHEVRFERALKLHHGEPCEVIAVAERQGETARVEVLTRRVSRTGREISQRHFVASARFGAGADRDETAMTLDPTRGEWLRGPNRAQIYERFFHEGTFQVLDEISCLSDEVIIGHGRLGDEALVADRDDAALLTDPLAREAAFQVAGLWGMLQDEVSYLPHGIERDQSFGRVTPGERFVIRARRGQARQEGILRFDRIEVCDERGALLHVYEGVEMVGHQKLREEARFARPWPARWTSLRIDTAALERWLEGRKLSNLLAEEEREEHERLISDRRRNEWLCARLATKELARCWARDFFGVGLEPSDFVILKDEHGAPSLAMRHGVLPAGPLPFITMSHSNGVACAAISAPGMPSPIGVDIERIEAREQAFERDYFTEEERALTLDGVERDAMITALWCCKEAVSKALGLGLKLRMADMLIKGFGEDGAPGLLAEVELRRDAESALLARGSSKLEVRLFIEEAFAFALARGVDRLPNTRPLREEEVTRLAELLRRKGSALSEGSRDESVGAPIWRH